MKVAVWDTYVTKKDGTIMHFDILVPEHIEDPAVIYGFGRTFLETKGQGGQSLAAEECSFCHVEALKPTWEKSITEQGFFIIEMENCN